jgi:hypothetical protein
MGSKYLANLTSSQLLVHIKQPSTNSDKALIVRNDGIKATQREFVASQRPSVVWYNESGDALWMIMVDRWHTISVIGAYWKILS